MPTEEADRDVVALVGRIEVGDVIYTKHTVKKILPLGYLVDFTSDPQKTGIKHFVVEPHEVIASEKRS